MGNKKCTVKTMLMRKTKRTFKGRTEGGTEGGTEGYLKCSVPHLS